MSKRKKIASVAFTGAAAVTAIGMGVPRAMAASGTWKITNGGNPYAGHVSGVNTTSATLDANGTVLTCHPGTAQASGSVPAASPAGPALGTISKATFASCSASGIFDFTAAINKPVTLSGSTYSAGVTKGKIAGGISATLNGVNGTTCHATIKGTSLSASYNNATHALTVNPGAHSALSIASVSAGHCSGLLTTGEPAAFTATYQFNPPLSVTGP
jgi:hypothetical protein